MPQDLRHLGTASPFDSNQLLPRLIPILEMANCSDLSIVYYFLGNFGLALFIRLYLEDVVFVRKDYNCYGTVFVQGDFAGGSELTEQTLTVRYTCRTRSTLDDIQYL